MMPRVPAVKGRIRAWLHVAGFIVERNAEKWKVTYIAHAGPKGAPIALLNIIMLETASCVGTFCALIDKIGPVDANLINLLAFRQGCMWFCYQLFRFR
ncbi:hypothetical protein BC830DRAFT_1091238 [Chytriomyces sp. MP71]|nr:hypothetical protein BC830DRAFT_1091238 [Chytriomyces sp. MP71]